MIFVTVPRQSYTNILLRLNCKASPAVLTHCTDHLTQQHIYAILLCYTDSETTGEYDGYIPDTTPRWREHCEIIRLLHLGLL